VGNRMLEELSQILSPDEGMAMVPVKIRVPETLMHTSEGKLVVNYKVRTANDCGMEFAHLPRMWVHSTMATGAINAFETESHVLCHVAGDGSRVPGQPAG
jgi:hypothetical protein